MYKGVHPDPAEEGRDGLLRRAPLAQDEPSRLRQRTTITSKIQYLFLEAALATFLFGGSSV